MTTRFSKIIVLSALLGGFSVQKTNTMWRSFTAGARNWASCVSRYVSKPSLQWNTTRIVAAISGTLLCGKVAYDNSKSRVIESKNNDWYKPLIVNGRDLNKPNQYGNTPLHRAIINNNIETTRYLINMGVDLERKNATGRTPLQLAVALTEKDQVKLLLENGAKVSRELLRSAEDRALDMIIFEHEISKIRGETYKTPPIVEILKLLIEALKTHNDPETLS